MLNAERSEDRLAERERRFDSIGLDSFDSIGLVALAPRGGLEGLLCQRQRHIPALDTLIIKIFEVRGHI